MKAVVKGHQAEPAEVLLPRGLLLGRWSVW